uniref:Uncharacterized protein n=1 Tax=Anguilla anguilla TaxID=7936 RepID=A0A0E9PN47_ANGAN
MIPVGLISPSFHVEDISNSRGAGLHL